MAKSIVLELQELASDRSNNVCDLLRKALIVATKLGIDDFKAWIDCELKGYEGQSVPEYRLVPCSVVALEYGVFKPIVFPDSPELEGKLSLARVCNSMSSLQDILADSTCTIVWHLPSELKTVLMQGTNAWNTFPTRTIARNALESIVDSVRTVVLRWALKLEQEGIVGEGISFSAEEKAVAASNPQIHIANFQGVLGDVSHSQVTQNLEMTVQAGDFRSLSKYLESKGVTEDDIAKLQSAIETDPTPQSRDKLGLNVSGWIGNMLTKAASGGWGIAVGAAGNLLAQAIAAYYGL